MGLILITEEEFREMELAACKNPAMTPHDQLHLMLIQAVVEIKNLRHELGKKRAEECARVMNDLDFHNGTEP